MRQSAAILLLGLWVSWCVAAEGPKKAKVQKMKAKPSPWAEFVTPGVAFYSSVLDARKLGKAWPAENLTPRGLILNLGNNCWACFDTDLLRVSAIWQGRGLTSASMAQGSYHTEGEKAPEGQGKLPEIDGAVWVANGIYPGWQMGRQIHREDPRSPCPDPNEVGRGPLPSSMGKFKAIELGPHGSVLVYEVHGVQIRDSFQCQIQEGQPVVQRSLRVAAHKEALSLALGMRPGSSREELQFAVAPPKSKAIKQQHDDDLQVLELPPSSESIDFQIAMGFSASVVPWNSTAQNAPAPLRWPQSVSTSGTLSKSTEAFVVD